jgi:general secretion pathway protein G
MKAGLKGFSLIEIMIVMMLIGIIVAGIAVATFGQLSKGQIKATRTEADGLAQKLIMYKAERRKVPESWEDLVKNGDLEKAPIDPWGNEYTFVCPGVHNPKGCDVQSNGPDGLPDTEDDVGNWDK